MRFTSFACVLAAASLVVTGCAADDQSAASNKPADDDVTIPADRIGDELPGLLRSYAVDGGGASVNVFGIPGQDSLNKAVEEQVMKDLEEAGAFKGKKAFEPETTSPEKRWDTSEYLSLDGASGDGSDAPTAGGTLGSPDAGSQQGSQTPADQPSGSATSGAGSEGASEASIKVTSRIVAAGGDYLVTQVSAEGGDSESTSQLLTDTKENTTEPVDSLKADGAEGDVAVEGGAITIGGEDAGKDALSETGQKLKDSLGEGLTIKKQDQPYLPDFSCGLLPCAAMTYDDGPADDALTKQLNDALDEAKVRATFFDIGRNAQENGKNSKSTLEAGHEVESHSFSHPVLNKLTAEKQKAEIDKTDEALHKATGEYPTMLRPPYGASNKRLDEVAQGTGDEDLTKKQSEESEQPAEESSGEAATPEAGGTAAPKHGHKGPKASEAPKGPKHGKHDPKHAPKHGAKGSSVGGVKAERGKALIMWDVDTADWEHRDAAYVEQSALTHTRAGSIVLMHAIHPTTVEAAPGIYKGLQDKGLYLVPVGYMFEDMGLKAGKEYFCRGYHTPLCSNPEHPYVEKDS